jgi:hypothetical protein
MPSIKIPQKADDCGGRKKLVSLKAELTLFATRGKKYVVEVSHNNSVIAEFEFSPDESSKLEYWEDVLECIFPKSTAGKEIIFHQWDNEPFSSKLA